jgi:dTDP-4-amino-4,6-dideoxygalactose transaminase
MSRIHLSAPDVGPLERDYLLSALESGWVAPAGPELDGFERDVAAVTGWQGAVALSSGTAALHLALLVSGVQPGDDVLVSSLTFAASANAVVHCGANPVFIDSERTSWNMDPGLLAEALTAARRRGRLPAAAIAVDIYGQCADYEAIATLCDDSGVALVEDAAEALGASHCGRPAGTLGDIGVFSFNGNKIVTTSGGGMVVTPDPAVADRVRYLATQAREPVPHFEHTEVGFNYRLSNLLAAIGRAQLARLDEMVDRRLAIHDRYRGHLADVPGITFMPMAPWGRWNGWLTCIVLDGQSIRDGVIARLAAQDIESRPLWRPMHLQPVFRTRPAFTSGVSDELFRCGLCLPSGSALSDVQIDTIALLVRDAVGRDRG